MRVSGLPRCGVSRSRLGTLSGTLAQPVHVVAERDQPRRQAGEFGERVAHPGGARHLAEGADMRQAGRAVAGLEQRVALAGRGKPLGDLGRFLERPDFWISRLVVAKCFGHPPEARNRRVPGQSRRGILFGRHIPPELPPMPPPLPPSFPPPPIAGAAILRRRRAGDRTAGARKNHTKKCRADDGRHRVSTATAGTTAPAWSAGFAMATPALRPLRPCAVGVGRRARREHQHPANNDDRFPEFAHRARLPSRGLSTWGRTDRDTNSSAHQFVVPPTKFPP